MKIPGLKSFTMLTHWLKSQFVSGALILGYHSISDLPQDPFSIRIKSSHLAEQLKILRKFTNPIRLQELVNGLRQRTLPKRAVVVTFDDGYADTLYQAKPILEKFEIPATVFISTGNLGKKFWWDKLMEILLLASKIPENISLSNNDKLSGLEFEDIIKNKIKSYKNRNHLLWLFYDHMLDLSAKEREKILTKLKNWIGEKTNYDPHCRAMTPEELIELTSGGLLDIGAHSVSHPLLSKLSESMQRSEIQKSKRDLQELLERPVTTFSYPNGSLSELTKSIVRESGYICACASHTDIAWKGSNCFHLPRFWIPNWDGERFYHWLKKWING